MIFDDNSELKRQEIIKSFSNEKDIIYSNNLDLFDDGIHLSYKGHRQMAELVEGVINE